MVGIALIVAGVILWLVFDASAYGLVSGIGVVAMYPVLLPRIEQWRKRERS